MKFSKYNIPVDMAEGIILYNTMMGRFVKIYNEPDLSHYKALSSLDYLPEDDYMVKLLYKQGYVVSETTDEYEEAKKQIEKFYNEKLKSLVIFLYVTENCNFRCIYCPQKHSPRILPISKYNALLKYIKNSVKQGVYESVRIIFFGGEPLLEYNKIKKLVTDLNIFLSDYPDIVHEYSIITNGYLLTPKVYDELILNHFKYFQITLDGFAENHNKSRPKIDGGETWQTIVDNLKYINSCINEAKIVIRSNYNDRNIDNYKDFDKWLDQTFKNKNIYIDISPISKFSESIDNDLIYKKEKSINIDTSNKVITGREQSLLPQAKACKYANRSRFVISASGKITFCEHAYDDDYDYVGNLEDNGTITYNENYKQWTENFEFELCKTCIVYPLCGARACPRKKALHPQDRNDCWLKSHDMRQEIYDMVKNGCLSDNKNTKQLSNSL